MAGKMLLGKLDRSAFGMLLLGLATAVLAQDYPSKPVRMVVGFPPNGGTDVVARILAPRMSELLGQPLVIDNRPGATGTVAAGQVAKAPGDGYTIMMGHVSVNAIAPALFSNLSYDVLKDFSPIAIAAAEKHMSKEKTVVQGQQVEGWRTRSWLTPISGLPRLCAQERREQLEAERRKRAIGEQRRAAEARREAAKRCVQTAKTLTLPRP
jgi:hypothetical protein